MLGFYRKNCLSLQDCTDLIKRKGDMCFIRLSCEIDAAVIDDCIDQAGKLSVTFCLRLPSHSYNSNDGSVADSTPTKKQLPNPSKRSFLEELSVAAVESDDDSAPETSGPTDADILSSSSTASTSFTSPKMQLFMDSNKKNIRDACRLFW